MIHHGYQVTSNRLISNLLILLVILLLFVLLGVQTAFSQEARWTLIPTDPQNTPGPRYAHGLVYDSNRSVVILFSGIRASMIPDESWADTWEWDGRIWHTLSGSGPVRYGFGMAFDPERNVTLLYGGYNHVSESIDLKTYAAVTWAWDGKEWNGLDAMDAPPRVGAALVYDPGLKCVIRHGGSLDEPAEANITNDTWKWDGVTWIKIAYGPARVFHKLVYDSFHKRVLLFGGIDKPGSAPGDTWEFDGTNWIQVSTEGPDGRELPGFAFDDTRGVAVLFGGGHFHGFSPNDWLGDTWEWDGFQWTPNLSPGPGRTYMQDIVYDSRRNRIFMFRGAGSKAGDRTIVLKTFQETWEYGLVTSGIPRRIWEGQ